ncbi:hypothetical protein [Pelagicoccus sp. SDUM812002]|uniref:hypothetical protein n=1 Tax=Pelagicoccus sp. SDUM812002 TaxID=3041266 RepID=UPI00280D6D9E|nr:hypothetical protein [Pelagicoccus sp. SDUM812002]MDQ8185768.1 hypothetical protein [Pelagicoccus sp. SDUM812002]
MIRLTKFLHTILLLGAVAFAVTAQAQMPDVKEPVQSAMQSVSVMAGDWTGSSWTVSPDGSRKNAQMHETIQWKLENTVLLIEGVGKNEQGDNAHHALGILSFEPFSKTYQLNSHIAEGLSTTASFEVVLPNEKFLWGYEVPGGEIRFTITLSQNGTHWHEKGEFSPDGTNWYPTMEMNLDKE